MNAVDAPVNPGEKLAQRRLFAAYAKPRLGVALVVLAGTATAAILNGWPRGFLVLVPPVLFVAHGALVVLRPPPRPVRTLIVDAIVAAPLVALTGSFEVAAVALSMLMVSATLMSGPSDAIKLWVFDAAVVLGGLFLGMRFIPDSRSSSERTLTIVIGVLLGVTAVVALSWSLVQQLLRTDHERVRLASAKDEFIAAISHELRTPLTAVVGLAIELRDGASDFGLQESAEMRELVAAEAADAAAIVEDLLVAARPDIGEVRIQLHRLDLGAVVEDLLRGLRNVQLSDIRIAADVAVLADVVRLRQVVRNLVTNAHRYGGDSIVLEVETSGRHGMLRVFDNGAGIPRSQRATIFEPYGRVADERTLRTSIGLGLSVSWTLVTAMAGDLTYDYVDGWSVFTVALPLAARVDLTLP